MRCVVTRTQAHADRLDLEADAAAPGQLPVPIARQIVQSFMSYASESLAAYRETNGLDGNHPAQASA
jgi:hypothetical protein